MRHVALILDGNRRWARRHNSSLFEAYVAGAARLHDIVEASIELKVDTVTAYILSRDNLDRSASELSEVSGAILFAASKLKGYLLSRRVRLSLLGDVSDLPSETRGALIALRNVTHDMTGLHLRLAVAYSGRRDLLNAARLIVRSVAEGHLMSSEISEGLIAGALASATANDPDILLRTGGSPRLSDFILYNLAYTSIVVDDALWPEFSRDRYISIVRTMLGADEPTSGNCDRC